MKRVAVILSGCGVYDGAEIREAVFTLLALDRVEAKVQCFAPDIEQAHVVNHLTGEPMKPGRNVLQESARIARGDIKPLAEIELSEFDAVLLPGGFGAAKNLCNFAYEGADMEVIPELASLLKSAHEAGKVLGFACIAPAIAAKVFGEDGVRFTIGNDEDTAETLSSFGGEHCDKEVTEIVVDEKLRIVTTPAYMYGDARLSDVYAGIENWVKAVIAMA